MEYICPKPTQLVTIPAVSCPENIGQIVKVVLQRRGYTFTDGSVPESDFELAASWTALLAKTDDDKIVVTPFLSAAAISGSEAITRGGGTNETTFGAKQNVGEQNPEFTSMIDAAPAAVLLAMKNLGSEDLVAYFIDQYDRIIGSSSDSNLNVTGFPIIPLTLFVSSADNKGYASIDQATFSFSLYPNWRDHITIFKPADWSPLSVIAV